jgi:hypothetical protein
MGGLSVIAAAVGVTLFVQSGHTPAGYGDYGGPGLQSISHVVRAIVGALIASRRPSNPVGWLLCASGLAASLGLNGFGYGYAYYSLEGPAGPLPAANWAAWFVAWLLPTGIWATSLAFQLFPPGRPVSRRWRTMVWLTIGVALLAALVEAVRPGPIDNFPAVQNPLGLPGAAGGLLSAFHGVPGLGPLALLLAVPPLLARFWQARGVERQQLKWVVYTGTLVPVYFAMLVMLTLMWPALETPTHPAAVLLWGFGWNVAAIATLSVSVGIAILRYRLFDIDLIIRRTLIYGVLTVGLALAY